MTKQIYICIHTKYSICCGGDNPWVECGGPMTSVSITIIVSVLCCQRLVPFYIIFGKHVHTIDIITFYFCCIYIIFLKMFTCGVCLKIFTRKDNLSRHLKSVAHRKTIIEYAPKTSTVYPEPSTTTAPTVQ
jgi:hypothetical protein